MTAPTAGRRSPAPAAVAPHEQLQRANAAPWPLIVMSLIGVGIPFVATSFVLFELTW